MKIQKGAGFDGAGKKASGKSSKAWLWIAAALAMAILGGIAGYLALGAPGHPALQEKTKASIGAVAQALVA